MKALPLRRWILQASVWSLIATTSAGAASSVFSYDSLNRFTNAAYSDGSRESYSYDDAGNRLRRITLAPTVQSDTVVPSVPSNLTTEEVSPTELRLTWNRSFDTGGSGMAGYVVYLNGVMVANTTATHCILTGLLANTPYSITIAAYDHAGNISDPSATADFFHPAPPSLRDPGLTSGILGFTLHGAIGSNYLIQASSNLVNWELILTNIILAASTLPLSDPDAANHPQRFYRALQSTNEPPEPSELIVNGGFEIPSLGAGADSKYSPVSSDLTGWIVGGAGSFVALVNSGARAAEGTNDLSFNGGVNGRIGTWVEQTFKTTPGAVYTLGFQAGRAGGAAQGVSIEVSLRSQHDDVLVSFNVEVETVQGFKPLQQTNFTATSPFTSVRFLDTTPNPESIDLLLDNVSVRRFAP